MGGGGWWVGWAWLGLTELVLGDVVLGGFGWCWGGMWYHVKVFVASFSYWPMRWQICWPTKFVGCQQYA